MAKSFTDGRSIDELAKSYLCAKLTVIRNLKKILGEKKYKNLIINTKKKSQELNNSKSNPLSEYKKNQNQKNFYELNTNKVAEQESPQISPFTEIAPLNFDIDNTIQKDLTSIPISDFQFPKIVYMIVDKKIELETKFLKEYPEWEFLSQEELNRKTIQIYIDLKVARRSCNKEQKVIKVPNTEVFKIVAPLLVNKGISRIVFADSLLAL